MIIDDYKDNDMIDKTHRIVSKKKNKNHFYFEVKCLECGHIRKIRRENIKKELEKFNGNLSPCIWCKQKPKYVKGEKVGKYEILTDAYYKKDNNHDKSNIYYTVKCLECGYIHEKTELAIDKKLDCLVCCGKIIKPYINDISITDPLVASWFWNQDDIHKYGCGSTKKVYFKCPDCGEKLGPFQIRIVHTYKKLLCKKCGDTTSYPERVVFSFFKEMGIDIDSHKSFKWSKGKEYDFYSEKLSLIVETHGEQHYKDNNFFKTTAEQQRLNDLEKETLAKQAGIKNYIQLNCAKDDFEYIKNNIVNNKSLQSIFSYNIMANLNWDSIKENSLKKTQKIIIDMWNSGERDIDKITKEVTVNRLRVGRYLVEFTLSHLLKFPYISKNYPKEKRIAILQSYGITELEWKKHGFDSIQQENIRNNHAKATSARWKTGFRKNGVCKNQLVYDCWNNEGIRDFGLIAEKVGTIKATVTDYLNKGQKSGKLNFPYITDKMSRKQILEILKSYNMTEDEYYRLLTNN